VIVETQPLLNFMLIEANSPCVRHITTCIVKDMGHL